MTAPLANLIELQLKMIYKQYKKEKEKIVHRSSLSNSVKGYIQYIQELLVTILERDLTEAGCKESGI